MEPPKTPDAYPLLTYLWVFGLSFAGGVVSFLRKRRTGEVRPFNVVEFIGELVTSGFVGVITFWLCEASGFPQLVTAAMVGISGHMGSRAIYVLEKWVEKRFGVQIPLHQDDGQK